MFNCLDNGIEYDAAYIANSPQKGAGIARFKQQFAEYRAKYPGRVKAYRGRGTACRAPAPTPRAVRSGKRITRNELLTKIALIERMK